MTSTSIVPENPLKHISTYRWSSGVQYTGEFLNSLPHGHGTMVFPNGNRYVGEFSKGTRHGYGVFTWGSPLASSEGSTNQLTQESSQIDRNIGFSGASSKTVVYNQPYNPEIYIRAAKLDAQSAEELVSPFASKSKPDLASSLPANGTMNLPRDSKRSPNDIGEETKALVLKSILKEGFDLKKGAESYSGQFVSNERQGFGVHRSLNGDVYEGEFYAGKKQGEGVLKYADGDVYRGQFLAGKRDGFGHLEYSCGNCFEGFWRDDRRNGKGKFSWVNGDTYEGEYVDDRQRGQGLLRLANGDTFQGSFKDNDVSGIATFHSHSKGFTYEGNFLEGQFHGQGLLVSSTFSFYEGSFSHGFKHGCGVSYDHENQTLFYEEWKQGSLFSRQPTQLSYDPRVLLKKRGLQGFIADKIVQLKIPTVTEPPAPYSSTKDSHLPLVIHSVNSPQGSGKTSRKSRSSSKASSVNPAAPSQSSSPSLNSSSSSIPNSSSTTIALPVSSSSGNLVASGPVPSPSPSRSGLLRTETGSKRSTGPRLQLNISGALNEKGGIPSEHYQAWKLFIGDSDILWEILSKRKWVDLHPLVKPLLPNTPWCLLYRTKATLFIKEAFRHGFGTFFWPNGNRYEGEWVDNKRHGIGVMYYGNLDIYYGEFIDGRKHGYGVYKFFNGTTYDGMWEKGRLHGHVRVTYCNGDQFDGIFYRGEKMGDGTMKYAKGSTLSFIGQWRRGRREGNGREVKRSGERFDSIWLNGNPIVEPKDDIYIPDEWQDWEVSQYDEERAYYRKKRIDRWKRTQDAQDPPTPRSQYSQQPNGTYQTPPTSQRSQPQNSVPNSTAAT